MDPRIPYALADRCECRKNIHRWRVTLVLFLIQESLEVTATFKQCKSQLVKEGFNPAVISDPLFFLDDSKACCVPMTQEIYSSIAEMRMKL